MQQRHTTTAADNFTVMVAALSLSAQRRLLLLLLLAWKRSTATCHGGTGKANHKVHYNTTYAALTQCAELHTTVVQSQNAQKCYYTESVDIIQHHVVTYSICMYNSIYCYTRTTRIHIVQQSMPLTQVLST
jgi:hypothetical protein